MKNFKGIVLFLIFSLTLASCGQDFTLTQQEKNEIDAIIEKQLEAWNSGDMETFMSFYDRSDSLIFMGKSGITYGWQENYDVYKRAFPGKEGMGHLHFEAETYQKIDKHTVLVVGSFKMTWPDREFSGYYSEIWRKLNGKWTVLFDHSS